jgi:polyisoprenoid-binding protein YceI
MTRLLARIAAPFALGAALFATPAVAADYSVDGVHTFANFAVQHLGAGFSHGRFNKISGSLSFDEANLATAKLSLEIDAASVDTNNAKRDDHLRGPDFFNVKQFPKITFESTAWKKIGDKAYEVTGNLSLHGVTKSITVPVTHTGTGKGFKGETLQGFVTGFSVDRTEYGVSWKPEVLGTEVKLNFSLEAVSK